MYGQKNFSFLDVYKRQEQEQFRDWLLSQPPAEILNHAYEYTVREDILMTLETRDLENGQAGRF